MTGAGEEMKAKLGTHTQKTCYSSQQVRDLFCKVLISLMRDSNRETLAFSRYEVGLPSYESAGWI